MLALVEYDSQMEPNVTVRGDTLFENFEIVELTLGVIVIRGQLSMKSLASDVFNLDSETPLSQNDRDIPQGKSFRRDF
jgi:hypothetical protein